MALVSFAFFLVMLLVFYVRQQIGYFILATAFLVVNIFTMIGWLMQRRNVVQVFENGISYRKDKFRWEEITGIALSDKSGLEVSGPNGIKMKIPNSIDALERLADAIDNLTPNADQ